MQISAKREMGRPPIAGVAMVQGSIRLTPDEWKEVDAVAATAGLPRNQTVRRAIMLGMKQISRQLAARKSSRKSVAK